MSKSVTYELPTDNHDLYDWKSKYTDPARKKQTHDAIYLSFVLLINFVLIFLNYINVPYNILANYNPNLDLVICKKLVYCGLFGMLGGTTFDIKCFYRAVARGQWHEDRIFWRFFTPWVSIPLALVMFAIFNKTIVESNTAIAISIGFFSGYFSDDAIGKMSDVAQVIFSRNNTPQKSDTNEK